MSGLPGGTTGMASKRLQDEAAAAGIPVMKNAEVLEEYRPEVLKSRRSAASKALNAKRKLDPKFSQLLICAIEAANDGAWRNIHNHINRALELGATVEELMDVFLLAGSVRGAICWSYGLERLDEVIQSRRAEGLVVPGVTRGQSISTSSKPGNSSGGAPP